jgi:hypothetical protein
MNFFGFHHVYLPASLRNQKAPEMMIELMGRGFAPVINEPSADRIGINAPAARRAAG